MTLWIEGRRLPHCATETGSGKEKSKCLHIVAAPWLAVSAMWRVTWCKHSIPLAGKSGGSPFVKALTLPWKGELPELSITVVGGSALTGRYTLIYVARTSITLIFRRTLQKRLKLYAMKPHTLWKHPHRIPTSSIPEFLLWQVHKQGSQKSMNSPNEHFL